jgi:GTPase
MKHYDEELDFGNIEYKLKLVHTSKERIEGLITQMHFRLREGNGECFYQIGVEDNGNPLGLNEEDLKASLETLYIMTSRIGATMHVLSYSQGKEGLITEILVTKAQDQKKQKENVEIRIGLLGEESSGKSTLVRAIMINLLFRLVA